MRYPTDEARRKLKNGKGKCLLPDSLRTQGRVDLRLVRDGDQQLLVLFERRSYLKQTYAPGKMFYRKHYVTILAVENGKRSKRDKHVEKLVRRAKRRIQQIERSDTRLALA